MQALTASSFFNLSVLRDIIPVCIAFYVRKRRILVHFYSAFMFLLEFTKTSSMVKKGTLNKSFQISYTFLKGSKYQTSNDLVYPQLSSKMSTLTPSIKDKEFPSGLYLMERRNTCITIRKLLSKIMWAVFEI